MTTLYIKETTGDYRRAKQTEILTAAKTLAAKKYLRIGDCLSPDNVRKFLQYALQGLEAECFVVIFLDNQHQIIEYKELFYGTIDSASVYPREVVKQALHHNAAAVIFAHNHPSGLAEPSQADRTITDKLNECLQLFNIRVLDHFIIGSGTPYSFAENNLLSN